MPVINVGARAYSKLGIGSGSTSKIRATGGGLEEGNRYIRSASPYSWRVPGKASPVGVPYSVGKKKVAERAALEGSIEFELTAVTWGMLNSLTSNLRNVAAAEQFVHGLYLPRGDRGYEITKGYVQSVNLSADVDGLVKGSFAIVSYNYAETTETFDDEYGTSVAYESGFNDVIPWWKCYVESADISNQADDIVRVTSWSLTINNNFTFVWGCGADAGAQEPLPVPGPLDVQLSLTLDSTCVNTPPEDVSVLDIHIDGYTIGVDNLEVDTVNFPMADPNSPTTRDLNMVQVGDIPTFA